MVLDDDDLLEDILLRLVFLTSLVRVAAVCRRWLRVVSDPAFLRRFRDLHPPRLLGLYLNTDRHGSPMFVPTPHPPTELAAVIRRAGSILGAASGVVSVLDCQNGRLLAKRNKGETVLISLLHPARDAVPLPPFTESSYSSKLLNTDGVAYAVFWEAKPKQEVRHVHELRAVRHVHELQDGSWHWQHSRNLTSSEVDLCLARPILMSRSVNGKLLGCAADIATLPSPLNLSIIALPDDVEDKPGGSVKTWADDSYLYLIHVKELRLHVWVYMMDSGRWLLQDTICLREVCAKSGVADLVSGDGLTAATAIKVHEVGHNPEFVLLQVGSNVLYIHMKSRTVERVYTVTREDGCWIKIVPFTMTWPLIFPTSINEDITESFSNVCI